MNVVATLQKSMQKPFHSSKQPFLSIILLAFAMVQSSCVSSSFVKHQHSFVANENLPDFLADPFEPVNRATSVLNAGLLLGFVRPVSTCYRALVPQPARRSIGRFAYNLHYPNRLINHSLQGEWKHAGTETSRFLTNSTVGIAGLLDPASYWRIPKKDTQFADTFIKWGWTPKNYIVLPVFGPSDETHATGFLADKTTEPWNYAKNLPGLGGAMTLNRLSDQVETIANFIQTEPDPYVKSKYLWSFANKKSIEPLPSLARPHAPSLETIDTAKFRLKDPHFSSKSIVRAVSIPKTGKKMKYNYWLQKDPAPVAFVAPGLGSHRISKNTLLIAEHLFENGFSVVTTVGIFHPEFMANASSSAMPAYPPADRADMLSYFTEIHEDLSEKHPGKLGKSALVGFSLGGFQALQLAANEVSADKNQLRFDRYLAINPPINLRYGDKELDRLFDAAQQWPAAERKQRINQTLQKAAALAFVPPSANRGPMFDGIESKYLVGLTFRIILSDSIYQSQAKNHQGILKSSMNPWLRSEAYNEILAYSFHEYFETFALPYYAEKGISASDFTRETNLKSYQQVLRKSDKIRVITNENDFLLQAGDTAWLKKTLGSKRLHLFPNGGHIGNMASEPVKQAMLTSLEGLQ